MTYGAYYLNPTQWENMSEDVAKTNVGSEQYNKDTKAYLEKKHSDKIKETSIGGVSVQHNPIYLSPAERQAERAKWENAKKTVGDIVERSNNEELKVEWQGIADDDYVNNKFYNNILEKRKDFGLSQQEYDAITEGLTARQHTLDPFYTHIAKSLKKVVGEIDTSFDALDNLRTFLTTSDQADYIMRLTTEENIAVNHIKESMKEGSLTAKKSAYDITSPERLEFAQTFKDNMDKFIRGGREAGDAKRILEDLIINVQRDVVGRTPYKPPFEDTEETRKYYVKLGLNTIERMLSYVDSSARTSANALNRWTVSNKEGAIKYLNDATTQEAFAQKRNLAALSPELRTTPESPVIKSIDANNRVAATQQSQTNAQAKTQVKFAEQIISSVAKKSGWSKGVMGLAAGILMGGYVGGNPATPSGEEAKRTNDQQEQPFITATQIPELTDSSLIAMRGGPKQGYIININAQSQDSNDYVGRILSSAMRNTYDNNQINIALKVNETQSNITNEDLYDYFAQAF